MFQSPFQSSVPTIDQEADIIFVADMFVEDYVGGAELTTEALIQSANDVKVQKLRSHQVALSHLKAGMDKHWVFCNFTGMEPQLIPSIIGNLSYSIIEYLSRSLARVRRQGRPNRHLCHRRRYHCPHRRRFPNGSR